jgi:hypothetical protein
VRRHVDRQGRAWDVLLGRESFGAFVALFVPAGENPAPPRQAHLRADSQAAGDTELDALSTEELDELLEGSEPKSMQ